MTVRNGLIAAFDAAAPTYDHVGVDFFGPFAEALVRHAGIRPGERVLDVGCGRGAVLFPAAEATGPTGQVIGVDLAPAMVDLCRRHIEAAGLRHVSVEVGDAGEPPFAPGGFDVVTAGLVLFFLPDPRGALRTYRRLLRPGGRLAFSSFARNDPHLVAAMRALAAHLPPGGRPTPAPDPLFAGEDTIREALMTIGYADPAFTEVTVKSRFRDAAHWLEWAWSHGARMLLQQIAPDRLAAAGADAAAALAGARGGDGTLSLTTTVRLVGATGTGS